LRIHGNADFVHLPQRERDSLQSAARCATEDGNQKRRKTVLLQKLWKTK
jgi:hypothetical protein